MNVKRLRGFYGYFDEWDVSGAQWVSNNIDIQNTQMYASFSSITMLISYGMVSASDVTVLTNVTIVTEKGTIYLDRLNVVEGIFLGTKQKTWNRTDFSFIEDMNRIYSNGASEICRNVGND
jgi:uncharacterized membrane protein